MDIRQNSTCLADSNFWIVKQLFLQFPDSSSFLIYSSFLPFCWAAQQFTLGEELIKIVAFQDTAFILCFRVHIRWTDNSSFLGKGIPPQSISKHLLCVGLELYFPRGHLIFEILISTFVIIPAALGTGLYAQKILHLLTI